MFLKQRTPKNPTESTEPTEPTEATEEKKLNYLQKKLKQAKERVDSMVNTKISNYKIYKNIVNMSEYLKDVKEEDKKKDFTVPLKDEYDAYVSKAYENLKNHRRAKSNLNLNKFLAKNVSRGQATRPGFFIELQGRTEEEVAAAEEEAKKAALIDLNTKLKELSEITNESDKAAFIYKGILRLSKDTDEGKPDEYTMGSVKVFEFKTKFEKNEELKKLARELKQTLDYTEPSQQIQGGGRKHRKKSKKNRKKSKKNRKKSKKNRKKSKKNRKKSKKNRKKSKRRR